MSNHSFIEWNDNDKLQWTDFRGVADPKSSADAGTAINISAKPYRDKGKVKYDVRATFLPDASWKRVESESLLAHEQLHFDIAELYARKIRMRVDELSRKGVKEVLVYHREIEKLLEESNQIDASYDRKTLHGSLTDKQQMWEKNITHQLHSLEKYSSSAQK